MKIRLSSYILIFTLVVMLDVTSCIRYYCGDNERNIPYTEFIDVRDGKTYKTLKMPDSKIWMTENLNFVVDSSWCYDDEDSNCVKYGRLYNWEAAMSACPTGWRLPTEQDWNNLIKTTGHSYAGMNLKSKPPIWDGRDKFGFSALPGGLRMWYGAYRHGDNGGYWWLATMRGNYFYRYTYWDSNHMLKDKFDSTICHVYCEDRLYGYSVRCVQNN